MTARAALLVGLAFMVGFLLSYDMGFKAGYRAAPVKELMPDPTFYCPQAPSPARDAICTAIFDRVEEQIREEDRTGAELEGLARSGGPSTRD